ncbi:MAG: hypothetical protein HZA32_20815 [Opitutae bacterium]|nr:hypothetical protein [Opitutae bacterium]
MKLIACLLAGMIAVSATAADAFLKNLPPEKFAAAGLNKLTAEELAQLEQLIAEREQGAVKTAVATVRAEAPKAAAKAETKASGPSWLRALVTLQETADKPEAAEAVESRLAGDYEGWTGKTVFKLENGQIWQQTGGSARYDDKRHAPAVKIYPGMLGAYWLEIEGVRERVKVKPVKLN